MEGAKYLPIGVESDIFLKGGGGGCRWSEPEGGGFWRFEPFSMLKEHSVNTEHQLKSKLALPVC